MPRLNVRGRLMRMPLRCSVASNPGPDAVVPRLLLNFRHKHSVPTTRCLMSGIIDLCIASLLFEHACGGGTAQTCACLYSIVPVSQYTVVTSTYSTLGLPIRSGVAIRSMARACLTTRVGAAETEHWTLILIYTLSVQFLSPPIHLVFAQSLACAVQCLHGCPFTGTRSHLWRPCAFTLTLIAHPELVGTLRFLPTRVLMQYHTAPIRMM